MTRRSKTSRWLVAGLISCVGLVAHAAGPAARNADPLRLQYEREKADCMTAKTNQPRDVCLREANAAYRLARQGKLVAAEDTSEQWVGNAVKRCQAQPAGDRELCERRVREGQVEGSVGGGGQIKSLTVRSTDIPKTPN